MKRTFPLLHLDVSIIAIGMSVKHQNRMANSVDSDETAHMSRLIRIYTVCTASGLVGRAKRLTHLCRVDSSIIIIWNGLFPSEGCLVYYMEIYRFNAVSVDPGQTPCYVASDLGLLCLSWSPLWDAMRE